jgi:hypothetical protein
MFHLAQNLWKKIQKTHLVECYRENNNNKLINGMHLLQRLLQKNKENKKREKKKKKYNTHST